MIRSTAFAPLAILAALAVAPLGARAESGNVVGGGAGATLSGGGDNMQIAYSTGGAGPGGGAFAQSARLARFAGNSDGIQVEYLAPAASTDTGREARLVGGGDNAEVVYR